MTTNSMTYGWCLCVVILAACSSGDGGHDADGGGDASVLIDAGGDGGRDAGGDDGAVPDSGPPADAATDAGFEFTCTPAAFTCTDSGQSVQYERCQRGGPQARCELRAEGNVAVCATSDCLDCNEAVVALETLCPDPVCAGPATPCGQRPFDACAVGIGGCSKFMTCTGTAVICSAFDNNLNQCANQVGCFVSSSSPPRCLGVVTSCNALSTMPAQCAGQHGCAFSQGCIGLAFCPGPNEIDVCTQTPGCHLDYP